MSILLIYFVDITHLFCHGLEQLLQKNTNLVKITHI